jgi:hypothetical protein
VEGTIVGNISKGHPPTFDEYAWCDRNNNSSNFTFDGGIGFTSGGMSVVFPKPCYQLNARITAFRSPGNAPKTWTGGRFLPDISGMVGIQGVCFERHAEQVLHWDELLGSTLRWSLCRFVRYAGKRVDDAVFRDITSGNNDSCDLLQCSYFEAGPEYNLVTGLGSIDERDMLRSHVELFSSCKMKDFPKGTQD